LVVVTLAFMRERWDGDGMRHLPGIVAGEGFTLGAARWLFFPSLIYAFVRPYIWLGWITTPDGAERVFSCVSLLCVLVVLGSIRGWLTVRGGPPRPRAAAIVIAAVSAPMLRMATDNIEPTFALAPAMAALAYAAERGRDPATARRALLVAIAGIGFSSL